MFFTFKLTSKRILLITSVLVVVLLFCGFMRAAASEPKGVICKTDDERVAWLSEYGVTASPTLLWQKEATIGTDGIWAQYADIIARYGFNLSDYEGKRAAVHCYMGTGEYLGKMIRVISVEDRVIAYEMGGSITIGKSDAD